LPNLIRVSSIMGHHRAEETTMANAVGEFIREIKGGAMQSNKNITLGRPFWKRDAAIDFLTLDQAHSRNILLLTEESEELLRSN